MNITKHHKRTSATIAFSWLVIILAAFGWNLWAVYEHYIISLPKNIARNSFDQNTDLRVWLASLGGIYVPVSKTTPPNPFLSHLPDRDTQTSSGLKLTLMNPASAIRHFSEHAEHMETIWHITSLNLLNLDNLPVEWETAALHAFEKGAEEVIEYTEYNGKPHLHLMRPLKYQKNCHKCHQDMGYELGDVRGGVGAYFPMEKSWQSFYDRSTAMALSYSGLLFSGFLVIGFVYVRQKKLFAEKDLLETELRNHHDHLEELVNIRTNELKKAHEQLLHAEKLSAIGSLSASISHEFNNPLQGVMTIIKGIRKRATFVEEDVKLVDMAVNECERMKNLINSLQDFNRPTSGRIAPVDIHATINSLLLLSKKEYTMKGIVLETQYAENMPTIKAVADQLKQVILNVLNNAAYACKKGGMITINTGVLSNNRIVIKIHDTGTGIKPEDMGHIFDPFFTTKPEVKGTGLGLSISYGIIKKHGGQIQAESTVDKGTTFSISLPID